MSLRFRDDDTRCAACGQRLAPKWDSGRNRLSAGARELFLGPQQARMLDILWRAGTDYTATSVFRERVAGTDANVRATMSELRKRIKPLGLTVEGRHTFGYRLVRLAEK